MLRLITDRRLIERSEARLLRELGRRATKRGSVILGYQGGSQKATCFRFTLHADRDFWFCYLKGRRHDRWANAFGYGDPFAQSVSIVVEINVPVLRARRDIAGAFATDDEGNIVVVHRGKVGGGRKGIGKKAFLERYSKPLEPMTDGDKTTQVIPVGVLDLPPEFARL